MAGFTEEQIEEMIREAVEKTEKSFGATFKRLKTENEELRKTSETAAEEFSTAKSQMEERIAELEQELGTSRQRISELAVRGEIQRQLRETGPLPDEFLDIRSIEYSDDPETLRSQVAEAIDTGRKHLGEVLEDLGIAVTPRQDSQQSNPTNPPSRDTKTAHDLKRSSSQDVLRDMMRRGLIR